MKQKGTIQSASKYEAIEHKNARTSHQGVEKAGKKKLSFFGDRASRQFVRDEMIQDGLDFMNLQTEMEEARLAREEEANRYSSFSL